MRYVILLVILLLITTLYNCSEDIPRPEIEGGIDFSGVMDGDTLIIPGNFPLSDDGGMYKVFFDACETRIIERRDTELEILVPPLERERDYLIRVNHSVLPFNEIISDNYNIPSPNVSSINMTRALEGDTIIITGSNLPIDNVPGINTLLINLNTTESFLRLGQVIRSTKDSLIFIFPNVTRFSNNLAVGFEFRPTCINFNDINTTSNVLATDATIKRQPKINIFTDTTIIGGGLILNLESEPIDFDIRLDGISLDTEFVFGSERAFNIPETILPGIKVLEFFSGEERLTIPDSVIYVAEGRFDFSPKEIPVSGSGLRFTIEHVFGGNFFPNVVIEDENGEIVREERLSFVEGDVFRLRGGLQLPEGTYTVKVFARQGIYEFQPIGTSTLISIR